MKYKAIYRCRLCKEIFGHVCTTSEKSALKAVSNACTPKVSALIYAPELHMHHRCADGSFGIADFYGIKKEEDGDNG